MKTCIIWEGIICQYNECNNECKHYIQPGICRYCGNPVDQNCSC